MNMWYNTSCPAGPEVIFDTGAPSLSSSRTRLPADTADCRLRARKSASDVSGIHFCAPIAEHWSNSWLTQVGSDIEDDGGFPATIGLGQGEAMERHRFDVHPHAMS